MKLTSPRFYRKEEKKLKRLHRWVSRKKKGSENRKKAKKRLARFYDKINNRRKDWVHKTTTKLAELYDAIILEDLNVKGMQQFTIGVSKSVTLDFSWSEFVRLVEYKLEERGKYVIKVDRFFLSSKQCSTCGYTHTTLRLSEREWTCSLYGAVHDQDVNASRNVYSEGCRTLDELGVSIQCTVGTKGPIDDACGGEVSPHFEATSLKQETICL